MFVSKMLLGIFSSVIAGIALLAIPVTVQANMSSTPWIHTIIQDGGHVEITISIFDEVEASVQGEKSFPELDAPYTLEWISTEGTGTVFEGRVFLSEDADEVIEYGCHEWDPRESVSDSLCVKDPSYCVDCDQDAVPDCFGICGVAYHYQVTDYCPGFAPDFWYEISTSDDYDINGEPGSLGSSNWITVIEEEGDECDSGCSVSRVGNAGQRVSLFQILMNLI